MFNFIGCGSAFNTDLGNNGAFIKKDNVLFLIDCGSSTFGRLKRTNVLEGITEIYVLITHTHADHIGSLGDLILYGYYSIGKIGVPNVTIITPKDLFIDNILKMMGVEDNTYKLSKMHVGTIKKGDFEIQFEAINVNHVSELECFGYILYYENKTIYYSGDCYEIPNPIIEEFNNGAFDLFYQDTCKADYQGNVHLSLSKLSEQIPHQLRAKVYCMHLDDGFSIPEAESLGFNVVKSII